MQRSQMDTRKIQQNKPEEIPVNLRLKLAGLWTSFMFLYIYVDYFHLFMPGAMADMMAGKVFAFKITPIFLLVALVSVTIPALMIFLSIALPAKVSRLTNMIMATAYIPYTLFNLAGEAWMHMVFGAALEVILLLLILRYALQWPRVDK